MTDTTLLTDPTRRAWIEVDLDALRFNARSLQAVMSPGCRLMAVVKANAYGHGAATVARALNGAGVDAFAVATAEEGAALREEGVTGLILVFCPTAPEAAGELLELDLTQTVVSADYAARLARFAPGLKVHVEIDTGMNRSGIRWDDSAAILSAMRTPGLNITGLYTHLSASDSLAPEDAELTRVEIDRFEYVKDLLRRSGVAVPPTHIQSTYGLLNYPELRCHWARIGMALYGDLSYDDRETVIRPELRPVLSMRARVTELRRVPAGENVGYGRDSRVGRDSVVATVSAGYCDGIPRALSNGAGVLLIRGREAPTLGRVCMDQLSVDVTDIPGVAIGDVATFIGADGDLRATASRAARMAGSFTPELMGRLGARVPVIARSRVGESAGHRR